MASVYSGQLREWVEVPTQEEPWKYTLKERMEKGRTMIFNFDYPFYDEKERVGFELAFIKNFYMREIGFEVEGLFQLRLDNWLNLNMPKWNRILEAERLEYDPFEIVNYTRNTERNLDIEEKGTTDSTGKQTDSSSSNGTSSSNQNVDVDSNGRNFNRTLESTTPDDRLAITTNDGSGVIEYATQINENLTTDKNSQNTSSTVNDETSSSTNGTTNSEANASSNRTQSDDELFNEHVKGNYGSQSYMELLQRYRDVQINIYKQIFNEMEVLFMGIY